MCRCWFPPGRTAPTGGVRRPKSSSCSCSLSSSCSGGRGEAPPAKTGIRQKIEDEHENEDEHDWGR
jgi:hypothetical protein